MTTPSKTPDYEWENNTTRADAVESGECFDKPPSDISAYVRMRNHASALELELDKYKRALKIATEVMQEFRVYFPIANALSRIKEVIEK